MPARHLCERNDVPEDIVTSPKNMMSERHLTSSCAPSDTSSFTVSPRSVSGVSSGTPTSETPVSLAVFDYDGTIIDGQSGSLFSRYLMSRHLITPRTLARLAWWGIRYKLHMPYRQDEARELIFRDLAMHSHEETLQVMREFHESVLVPRRRADAVAEVRRVHDEGCVTLLVSATFQEIAHAVAESLGFDGVVATRMELDKNGRFTGRVEGEVIAGEGKCRAVAQWANEHIGPGRWSITYAYGDHISDEPLLEQAEHGFAVCPDKTLRLLAHRRDWPVLEWK